MIILYSKAFHVIGLIAWFAAIFFLGRMYIYHHDGLKNNDKSIITLCEGAEKRLIFIILLPSAIIATFFGGILIYYTNAFSQGWFHVKFLFLLLFFYYNHYLVKLRKKFIKNETLPTKKTLSLLNEVPFILSIIIVLLVYLKSTLNMLIPVSIIGLFIIFYILYKKRSNSNLN